MPNLQIYKTIENTSFLRNCMNMHSIQRRKQPGKMHQYAPEKQRKTSNRKPRDFFICRHNTDFVWDNGIYHHRIIITSPYHIIAIGITGTHPGQHPRKEGGL